MIDLFSPLELGPYALPNRIFMAPLTRCRARPDGVPVPMMATYYQQRATAGLILSEATCIAPEAVGYPNVPGLWSDAQVTGWRPVTDAVHAAGGRIFAQLWHVGRVSHPCYQPNGALPVAPSAIACPGKTHTPSGDQPRPVPRALETDEVPAIIEQYRRAAANALSAGFDGVELHGANGYLPDQFLRSATNQRTDRYGGSIENRARFHLDATRALIAVCGAERVGVKLSPSGVFNGMSDADPIATFSYVIRELNKLGIAFLHVTEAMESDIKHGATNFPVATFRPLFDRVLITNAGFSFEKAQRYLSEGAADAVAFGVLFIANPDLPRRFREDAPLNQPDPTTFYSSGAHGYIDYPALSSNP
ncbi:MAG: alkene reductase [Phycisphaerales bacterium]|nr:alkene reductase [Phycisphaerales bacterium]